MNFIVAKHYKDKTTESLAGNVTKGTIYVRVSSKKTKIVNYLFMRKYIILSLYFINSICPSFSKLRPLQKFLHFRPTILQASS